MTHIADLLADVMDDVASAEEAIREFDDAFLAFFNSDQCEVIDQFDPHTGYKVRKIRLVNRLPVVFKRKVTEAILNSKHAFDQATYVGSVAHGRSGKHDIHFPWANDPNHMLRRIGEKGIPEPMHDVIAEVEPYPTSQSYTGGNDIVRGLATLANDKHTFGLSVLGNVVSVLYPPMGMANGSIQLGHGAWDPKKNEIEILRYRGNLQSGDNYQITFQILLNRTKFSEPMNASDALRLFTGKAKAFAKSVEALCKRNGKL